VNCNEMVLVLVTCRLFDTITLITKFIGCNVRKNKGLIVSLSGKSMLISSFRLLVCRSVGKMKGRKKNLARVI
jgi:hypothetical protein